MRKLLFALCCATGLVLADELPPGLEPVPDGPPSLGPAGASVVPEITVIEFEDRVVREHRAGGRLYMIQVVPKRGPAYFLVDEDGNGELESRYDDRDRRILIPAWVPLTW